MNINKKQKRVIGMIRKSVVEVVGGIIVLTAVVFTGTKLIDKDSGAAAQILVATVSGYFGFVSSNKPTDE